MKISIVTPTFNEIENIENSRIFGYEKDLSCVFQNNQTIFGHTLDLILMRSFPESFHHLVIFHTLYP